MINLALTITELDLLTTLAGDQLFRKEFIDPKMPGYKADNQQIDVTKTLLARLRSVIADHRSVHPAHLDEPQNAPSRAVNRAIPFNNRSEKR